MGNRFPVPKELGGIRASTLLRSDGSFVLESLVCDGKASGQHVWLNEEGGGEEEMVLCCSTIGEEEEMECCVGPKQAPR